MCTIFNAYSDSPLTQCRRIQPVSRPECLFARTLTIEIQAAYIFRLKIK